MLVLLLSALPVASGVAKPHCTLRVHLAGKEEDGAVFSSQLQSPATGKNVVIHKIPAISEHDVVAYSPYHAADGSCGALFQFDDHGRLVLDTLSVEQRGTYLYVFVNGRPVAELQIDRRITDGRLYLASGLTEKDLALMQKDWPRIGQRKR